MKISIITVCYNSAKTIEDTIRSVLAQTYDNIEYIIVDGLSKDETLAVVNKYKDKIGVIISERDKGIYDAMNKGILMATGDVIGILNSDDVFFDNNTLQNVIDAFNSSNADAVFGNLYYVKADDVNTVVRFWKGSPYKKNGFSRGWHPAHPSFFVKRWVYEKYGVFDLRFDVSADFELMLRFIAKHNIKTAYFNEALVRMRVGGNSNKSIKKIYTGNVNIARAFKKNNVHYPFYYPLVRLAPKLLQFIKR